MLEPELLYALWAWADEVQACLGDGAAEVGILGEEAVSWDDCLCAGIAGFLDDLVAVEIGPCGVAL